MHNFELEVRSYVRAYIDAAMQRLGLKSTDFDTFEEISLVDAGIIDSIRFIEMIVDVEDEFGVEIDLTPYEPAYFTSLSGFVACVVAGYVSNAA